MSNTGSANAITRARGSWQSADNNPDRIEIGKCWFLRRGENRITRKKTSRSKEENQQQTQPTYAVGSGNRTRDPVVGGERSHHCAIPASLSYPLSNVFLSYPLSNVFISVSVYLENVRIGLSGNKLYSADHKIVLKRLLLSTKHYHCCQHAHLK